jgi:hypothetical protein
MLVRRAVDREESSLQIPAKATELLVIERSLCAFTRRAKHTING